MIPLKNIQILNRQISCLFKTSNNYEGMTAMPPCDFFETKDKYYLVAELPGLLKDDILIEIEGTLLRLKGQRSITYDGICYYQMERTSGQFKRTFILPQQLDEKDINARLKDGLLEIEISKSEKKLER